ncbi:5-oxoprolinase subunit PxpA [Ornithinibacillus scapharcae]|uniref:5-oxoprolinase subunit PxpA n=1 Tax=Ornithinibacillus scapharcae TaxID=1147159 RepID=UPI000309F8FF|nr:5-oxoprolinase subunit PxpA [Ornithinibacillus scapharcae]
MYIDLNCDMGEGFGVHSFGLDDELMDVITSANIACGGHAGDSEVMDYTVRLAKEKGVAIGAHPSYPDLVGFGRRYMGLSPEEIYRLMIYQIGSLQAFCSVHNVSLHHVKPHGALYNVAAKDKSIADAIAKAIYDLDSSLILYGLAGSELLTAGKARGLAIASEVFADRTYQADGSLTPRNDERALIIDSDKAVEQVKQIVLNKEVEAIDGTVIPMIADTICVHGDSSKALSFVLRLKEELHQAGIKVTSLRRKNE